jgi:arginine decarboxylase-like protein
MGEPKNSCYEFDDSYINLTEKLRKELAVDICNKILSTNHKNNMERTKKLLNLNNFLHNAMYYVDLYS